MGSARCRGENEKSSQDLKMKLNKTVAFTTPIDVDSKYYFVFGMYDFGMHDIVYARKSGLSWYFVNNTKSM